MAIAVELPAVIRALDAIAFDLAVAQRAAAMGADIGQAGGLAGLVAEQHEVLPQHPNFARLVGELRRLQGGIPEIDEHGSGSYSAAAAATAPAWISGTGSITQPLC